MFDWKILAASFAALLVVSSVLVGGFGFTDILDKLNEWMGDSPLSGLVTAPSVGSKEATITLHTDSFRISVNQASFTSGESEFTSFTGDVNANLTADTINLVQKDSKFSATLPLAKTILEKVSIAKFSMDETSFSVSSRSLETSGKDVSLEIVGFIGDVTITSEYITLEGNVTSITGNEKVIV